MRLFHRASPSFVPNTIHNNTATRCIGIEQIFRGLFTLNESKNEKMFSFRFLHPLWKITIATSEIRLHLLVILGILVFESGDVEDLGKWSSCFMIIRIVVFSVVALTFTTSIDETMRVQISKESFGRFRIRFLSVRMNLTQLQKKLNAEDMKTGILYLLHFVDLYMFIHMRNKLAMAKKCAVSVWSVNATVTTVICRYCKLRILILERKRNFKASVFLLSIPCIIVPCS